MVEGARFEIVWAAMSRGFESPLLRHFKPSDSSGGFFCIGLRTPRVRRELASEADAKRRPRSEKTKKISAVHE